MYWWSGTKILQGGWSRKLPWEQPDTPSLGASTKHKVWWLIRWRTPGWALRGDKKLFVPAAGRERGPCHNCPASRAGSSQLLCGSGKADKEVTKFLQPCPHCTLVCRPCSGRKKETYRNLVSQHALGMWRFGTSDTSRSCDAPLAGKQQYLPKAAPAMWDWQRTFRSSGEMHPLWSQVLFSSGGGGCPGTQGGTGLAFPAVQLAQYNPHKDPNLACVLLSQLAILRLLACQLNCVTL